MNNGDVIEFVRNVRFSNLKNFKMALPVAILKFENFYQIFLFSFWILFKRCKFEPEKKICHDLLTLS